MSDEIRINRSSTPAQQPAMRQEPPAEADAAAPEKSSKTPWVILGLIVVVLLAVGFLFRDKLFKGSMGSKAAPAMTQSSGFQAVFLTNGQVYFGNISHPNDNYVTLKDIYYLQVGPQQGSGTTTPAGGAAPQQPISLVKLGQELHGPVDEMHISRAQILFYEDLKADGSVVKAIQGYKANQSGGAPTTPIK